MLKVSILSLPCQLAPPYVPNTDSKQETKCEMWPEIANEQAEKLAPGHSIQVQGGVL